MLISVKLGNGCPPIRPSADEPVISRKEWRRVRNFVFPPNSFLKYIASFLRIRPRFQRRVGRRIHSSKVLPFLLFPLPPFAFRHFRFCIDAFDLLTGISRYYYCLIFSLILTFTVKRSRNLGLWVSLGFRGDVSRFLVLLFDLGYAICSCNRTFSSMFLFGFVYFLWGIGRVVMLRGFSNLTGMLKCLVVTLC